MKSVMRQCQSQHNGGDADIGLQAASLCIVTTQADLWSQAETPQDADADVIQLKAAIQVSYTHLNAHQMSRNAALQHLKAQAH